MDASSSSCEGLEEKAALDCELTLEELTVGFMLCWWRVGGCVGGLYISDQRNTFLCLVGHVLLHFRNTFLFFCFQVMM